MVTSFGYGTCLAVVAAMLLPGIAVTATDAPISEATQECIECHSAVHPGIVADWKRSRHAITTPSQALKKVAIQRRISAENVPAELAEVAVGCAECHSRNPGAHKDKFEHNDRQVHVTVSPKDCSTCHPEEATQFEQNLMSWARVILTKNPLYQTLIKAISGVQTVRNGGIVTAEPDEQTRADSCYYCHGTLVEVKGEAARETSYGEMKFPILAGWPNQGVGRFNPDGSQGSCTACHSRHQFSIEMARKPYTCSQCHKGPDVPAFPAYEVSKHSNLHSALKHEWDFKEVPWTVGKDFSAPTCAVCHVSLLVDKEGNTLAKRTHQMGDRLPWRILGLIYAHPHPKSPDTSIIRNKDGLPLPVTLDNQLAQEFLIDSKEMTKRQVALQKICLACHSEDWVKGHWARLENTINTSNQMTLAATKLQIKAWDEGLADKKESLFDEAIEKQWVEQWLFYANSTRFASAMMGADYGVFANGRWYMSKNLREMADRLNFLLNAKRKKK